MSNQLVKHFSTLAIISNQWNIAYVINVSKFFLSPLFDHYETSQKIAIWSKNEVLDISFSSGKYGWVGWANYQYEKITWNDQNQNLKLSGLWKVRWLSSLWYKHISTICDASFKEIKL